MKRLRSATLNDKLHIVSIETSFLRALPRVDIIGLPSATIKEAAFRVKSALQTIEGYQNPSMQVLISLTPSNIKKDGSHFDLAISLLILLQREDFDEDFFVFGELGLDGSVKKTNELFSILLFLSTSVKSAKVLLPREIALQAAMIPNLEVFAVGTLDEARRFFTDDAFREMCRFCAVHPLFKDMLEIGGRKFVKNLEFGLDFYDIKGQERAKRACLIAASGMHNILLEGSPGCGKSMSAKRLRYILPPQSLDEILLSAAYQSLNNSLDDFSALRPFRSPHHTSTRSSIFGGGSTSARIGEVALANGGILFFDEFPHFPKQILESLREPLEDNEINISRVNSKVTYKTKFLFLAAQNPCPCGNAFSKTLACRCSRVQIDRYKNAISSPLLDRIDLYCAMGEVSSTDAPSVTSAQMYERVLAAFAAQVGRGQKELNGKLDDEGVREFCVVDGETQEVVKRAVARFNLSQRAINKTLKVARTCADLAGVEEIRKEDVVEALSFRVSGGE